jgi:hypothetical protein
MGECLVGDFQDDLHQLPVNWAHLSALHHWRRRGWAKWATAQGLACLTPVLLCIGIVFSPYIVAVVCLIHVLLSETNNNEEGTENVFDKSLWRENTVF